MAYGRRKKGGQRLMEMSRAGAKRKAARKAKTLAQAKANIAKGPVTRGGAKKKAAPAKAAPKAKVAAAKPSTKPAAKKKVSSGPAPLPKTMVGRQSFGEALKEQGPSIATDAALIAALLASRGRSQAGKSALGRTMTRLKSVFKPKKKSPNDTLSVTSGRNSGLGGGKSPAATTSARPSGTPPKPSGPGSKTPKKPTGPGSRTTRKQTSTNKAADRTAKRKKRDERKERVAGGRKRVGQAKRRAGAARGRRTQRRQATLRGGGTVTY